MPLTSTKTLGLSYTEAIRLWVTGYPPKRLQEQGMENVTDMLEERKLSTQASKLFHKLESRSYTEKVAEPEVV